MQQAQRDAFANEVLEEFDLGQFKTEDDFQDEPNENQLEIKPEQPKKELIELSSDEEHRKKPPSSTLKAEDSDSSDIQIVEEVDDNVDDPDNSGMHTNDKLNNRTSEGKVIVNISEKNPNEVIHVADSIEAVIKPHQIGGVRFLYDNIIESPSVYEKSQGFGCILAHAMGLGKTLQIVTFSEVFLKATKGNHVLIIVPINTLQNWVSEFKHWLPHEPFKVHLLSDNLKTIQQRSNVILNWKKEGGVLMIGYELFRLLAGTKAQQRKKKAPKKPVCIDIEEEDKAKDILIGKNQINVKFRDLFTQFLFYYISDIRKILVDPGPDLVICDEGHRIKNAHASISQVLKAIKTRRRVVLTGYPLQNNLLEYWCMVDFVRPNYLGTKTEFSNMFERPIQNGQCLDSTPRDKRLMMHRAHVLHRQLQGFVQRRSHKVLQKNLPPKFEHVLLVKMTPFQRKLYATFTEDLLGQKSMANPLKAFAVCCKIWNHPDVLAKFLRQKELDAMDLDLEDLASSSSTNTTKKRGKKKVQKKSSSSSSNVVKSENPKLQNQNGNGYANPGQQQYPQQYQFEQQQFQQQQQQFYPYQQQYQQYPPQQQQYPPYQQYPNPYDYQQQEGYPQHNQGFNPPLTMLQQQVEQHNGDVNHQAVNNGYRSHIVEGPGFDPFPINDSKKDEISYEWANGMFTDYISGQIEQSNKFKISFELLEQTILAGERMLLFSQSLLTLDLIEEFLRQRNVPSTEEKWTNGTNYFRLDGSTPSMERDRLINAFNKAEAIKVPLFLVSTRAGSLGINLVGANRVIIFDASWNPCHDSQAVCRVYRYGQSKPCYIYRLVSDRCLEKKIYDRQINKQGMSDRVVDESNPDNYLSTKDIHSLWDEEDVMREIHYKLWDVPAYVDKCDKSGDFVLSKVLQILGQDSLSTDPWTHESLLVDRKEKKLSRIEKRLAERSYEAEKVAQISYTRPSYAAYYPKNNAIQKPEDSQNNIGCRKDYPRNDAIQKIRKDLENSWKPPPMNEDFEHEPPRAHPNYNGIMPQASQRLHANPPTPSGSDSNKFPIEALARREGVKLQEVVVPKDISIPTKNQTPIALKAGQRVMLIKTPKGIYLRYRDQIVKIRMPNGLLPFGNGNSTSSMPSASNSNQHQMKSTANPDVVTLNSSDGEDAG